MTAVRIVLTLGTFVWGVSLLIWSLLFLTVLLTALWPNPRFRGLPLLCWWHWKVMSWAHWFVIPSLACDVLYRSGWERLWALGLDVLAWYFVRSFKPPKPPRRRRKKSELPAKLREAFARVVPHSVPA